MKKVAYLSLVVVIALLAFSCNKDKNEVEIPENLEIQDFIWEGMNYYYLWKSNVPNLANSIDDNATSYNSLLNSYPNPDEFFESLIFDRTNTDKWSWIVDDYVALENSFQGISKSNGIVYRLSYEKDSNSKIFGYVRYILPNTDAAVKDVNRGEIFNAVNGVQLTIENYQELLAPDTYTLNFADLNGGNPISNGKSIELTKQPYQANPIYINKVIENNGKKIGYLMYNAFNSSFNKELNTAFGQLKSEGVTDLILDLRYNSGGSVLTSTYLASMITGQFTGELYVKENWNSDLNKWFAENEPTWVLNNFVNKITETNTSGAVVYDEPINSLNLSNIYIITTGSSASASELVINGLKPYINVITIGTKTSGKYTGSITLYDSPNFTKSGVNPNHFWAMQPIVLETINKLGENDRDGFDPTVEVIEFVDQMQELGLETEPLLARAIEYINTGSRLQQKLVGFKNKEFTNLKDVPLFFDQMYISKDLPKDLLRKN